MGPSLPGTHVFASLVNFLTSEPVLLQSHPPCEASSLPQLPVPCPGTAAVLLLGLIITVISSPSSALYESAKPHSSSSLQPLLNTCHCMFLNHICRFSASPTRHRAGLVFLACPISTRGTVLARSGCSDAGASEQADGEPSPAGICRVHPACAAPDT